MPIFVYNALSATGVPVDGEVTAPHPDDVREELLRRGLMVRSIRAKWRGPGGRWGRRVGLEELDAFVQEFATLLRAGVTVTEALHLVTRGSGQGGLASVLADVLDRIRAGTRLSQACAGFPEAFDPLLLASLRTGEATGDLVGPLLRYREGLRRRRELQDRVRQALAYPAFLLAMTAGLLGLLFVFVMPRFAALYASFRTELPLPTRILMAGAARLPVALLAAAVVAAGGWLAWKRWMSHGPSRVRWDEFRLRVPVLRAILVPLETARLARTLSTLLAGGTPVAEALETTRDALANRGIAARLERARLRILEGGALSAAFLESNLVTPSAAKLLEVAEASGTLESMLAEISDGQEAVVRTRLDRAMPLVEPVLVLVTGLIVGAVIVAMYLPVFRLAEILR